MRRLPLAMLPVVAGAFSLSAPPLVAAQQSASPYHTFAQVETILREQTASHRDLMTLQKIGTSAGGRGLYIVQVAAPGDVEPDDRPGVFVGANIAGYHNAGTEAALDLLSRLAAGADDEQITKLLATRVFYIAPSLNPDAHDGMFADVRQRLARNAMRVDRDRDGLMDEDGADDLNGDGRITMMRIHDPAGSMLASEDDPRLLIKADPMERQVGLYRIVTEGADDDLDGKYNEDGPGGVAPDMNFAHAFPFPDPDAGPWASYAPESQAIMDVILSHRNIALAVVYGPANNLLTAPRGLGGGGGDTGTMKLTVPKRIASFMGLDPEQKYTIDEIWEVVKDLPFVVSNNLTKEQILQFLGVGPATKPADEDLKYLDHFAEAYKDRLKDAGLDNKREGANYKRGGFTPWLYYQAGLMALELDVWGVPKPEKKKEEGAALTIDSLEEMSSDDFVALGEEKIEAFLKEMGAPPQFKAAMILERVESGQVEPKQMAAMMKRMGMGKKDKDSKNKGDEKERAALAWLDEHAPDGFAPWTPVTLPDGTQVDVGGFDPFASIAPGAEFLTPAITAHTDTVLEMAGALAQVELEPIEVEDLGGGVYRVKATARNTGLLPTHTKMDVRARTHLPARLEITLGEGVELITGHRWTTTDRLAGDAFQTQWLLHAGAGSDATIQIITENAGADSRRITFGD